VRVNGGVARRPCEALTCSIANVRLSIFILPPFSETHVHKVEYVALVPDTSKDVVGLDVSVNEATLMEVLETLDHLVAYHDCRLQREAVTTEVHQVRQARTQQIHRHEEVIVALSEIVDVREAGCALL